MGSLYVVSSRRLMPSRCFTSCSLNSCLFLCVCLSTATGGGHRGVLRRGSGAGGAGWHVLQQLLPLPAVRPGAGPGQRCQPVGAERAPGRREIRGHTGPLMDRGGGGGGGGGRGGGGGGGGLGNRNQRGRTVGHGDVQLNKR